MATTLFDGNGDPATATNGRFKITTERVLMVVVSVLLTYAAMTSRMSVVETRQTNTEQRLERIENKLDMLIDRR